MLEVQLHVVVVGLLHEAAERGLGARAEPRRVDLAEAVLHRRGVEVDREGVRREVVEVVRLEAGDVGRDLEAGGRELGVERVSARLARPLEDALGALADQFVGVGRLESALLLALLDERLRAVAEDGALRQERLDARARLGVEVVGHQHRREHAVLGAQRRAERRRDDRLALRAHAGHVVEVVRLHLEAREEAADPAVLVGAADADRAVTLAARALEFLVRKREAEVQPREERADRLVAGHVDQQRLVVERHFLREHRGKRRKEAVLEVALGDEADARVRLRGEGGHGVLLAGCACRSHYRQG
jgi:hypothetical protein